MAARSAPTRPVVRSAMGRSAGSASSARLILAACTLRMARRPSASGGSTRTMRSKRPGRTSAGSRMRRRFVAPNTTRPEFCWTPSMAASSCIKVCSCSVSDARMPESCRARPTASSSSMKTMHRWNLAAFWKSWRTRAAPRPAKISTKSEPEQYKNGTCASFARARARRVLPVPGGPTNKMPLGARAPTAAYFWEFCTKSFRSSTCTRASGLMPATSSNVMILARSLFAASAISAAHFLFVFNRLRSIQPSSRGKKSRLRFRFGPPKL
mmetsp:Transcript_20769/g.64157  ORF Transcript_20769/g.64157 Transcript_20769/m.64157 type:complete len:268 (+) Transcript_20769:222-1025(+)